MYEFNHGTKRIILNTYQCYLKHQETNIDMELETAKHMEHNLGIKLVRGAYMVEERKLAGKESPVWDTIEETHKCYNTCMTKIIDELDENS